MLEHIQKSVREKYGEELAKIERWSKFRTDETTNEWLEILGPTAVVLTHQEHMVETAKLFLENISNYPKEIRDLIYLAFAIHDIPEVIQGDIPAPIKTRADEEAENQAAEPLFEVLPYSSLLTSAYELVVAGKDEYLHQIFEAIEKTEYFMTGVNVFDYLMEHDDERRNLWLLVARVLAFDLPNTLKYAALHPDFIEPYILSIADKIEAMFEASSWIVSQEFDAAFRASAKSWTFWKEQHDNLSVSA